MTRLDGWEHLTDEEYRRMIDPFWYRGDVVMTFDCSDCLLSATWHVLPEVAASTVGTRACPKCGGTLTIEADTGLTGWPG